MSFLNLLKIAVNALLLNKTRSFLTMLGIIIGVASVITMLAIGQGSKNSIREQVSQMGTNLIMVMPGSQFRGGVRMGNSASMTLSINDVQKIKSNCSSVSMVSPEVRSSGQAIFANRNSPTIIYGGDVDYLDIKKVGVVRGRMFKENEVKSFSKVCLLGQTVVDNLFSENEDPIGKIIRFDNIPLKVIGILEKKGQNTFGRDQDDLIVAPYTTVQKRILAISYIQTIVASAVSEEKSKQAVSEIEATLRKNHRLKASDEDDFMVRSQEELIETFSSISDVLTILLGAIAGISLLVGGIGIMNIMYVSVTERTREIGLRMSVGGRNIDILLQFLTESILISVIGGLLGIFLGLIASKIIAVFMNWPVVVLPQSVLLSFLVCSVIGIFFGWYPARKAANMDPISALRYE